MDFETAVYLAALRLTEASEKLRSSRTGKQTTVEEGVARHYAREIDKLKRSMVEDLVKSASPDHTTEKSAA